MVAEVEWEAQDYICIWSIAEERSTDEPEAYSAYCLAYKERSAQSHSLWLRVWDHKVPLHILTMKLHKNDWEFDLYSNYRDSRCTRKVNKRPVWSGGWRRIIFEFEHYLRSSKTSPTGMYSWSSWYIVRRHTDTSQKTLRWSQWERRILRGCLL